MEVQDSYCLRIFLEVQSRLSHSTGLTQFLSVYYVQST